MGKRAAFAARLANERLPCQAEKQGWRLPRARGPHSPDTKCNRRSRHDDIRARGQLRRRTQRLILPTCQSSNFEVSRHKITSNFRQKLPGPRKLTSP
ncbi:hypothetical protein HanRHA438_Chr16g0757521 [Helianthus annuus]|nr:hypothetical protein HanRHA438_Chr16g0757521 [Helianthus annuus]